jgi:hypothetical protein
MGTRSLTHFYEKPREAGAASTPLLTLYRQYDGYLSGHGALISETFKGRRLTNGYSDAQIDVNGMTNAAVILIGAYYIERNQGGTPIRCGDLYITGAGASNEGEEYTYHLYPNQKEDSFHLMVEHGYADVKTTIFDGPLDDFNPLMEEGEE